MSSTQPARPGLEGYATASGRASSSRAGRTASSRTAAARRPFGHSSLWHGARALQVRARSSACTTLPTPSDVRHDSIVEAARELFQDRDALHLADMAKYCTMALPTAEGEVALRPEVGLMMGHAWAPLLFVRDYHKSIGPWNLDLFSAADESFWSYVTDPITEARTDLSLTTFVDVVDDDAIRRLCWRGRTQRARRCRRGSSSAGTARTPTRRSGRV